MTRPDLDALEALLERATDGPWEWWRDPGLVEDGVHAPDLGKRDEAGAIVDAVTVCRGMTGPSREANAAFICAARNALPDLLAELREARAVVEKAAALGTVEPDSFSGQCCIACGECCELDQSDKPPSEVDLDLDLVRWGVWFEMARKRAADNIKHAPDCLAVQARKLMGREP